MLRSLRRNDFHNAIIGNHSANRTLLMEAYSVQYLGPLYRVFRGGIPAAREGASNPNRRQWGSLAVFRKRRPNRPSRRRGVWLFCWEKPSGSKTLYEIRDTSTEAAGSTTASRFRTNVCRTPKTEKAARRQCLRAISSRVCGSGGR